MRLLWIILNFIEKLLLGFAFIYYFLTVGGVFNELGMKPVVAYAIAIAGGPVGILVILSNLSKVSWLVASTVFLVALVISGFLIRILRIKIEEY